MGAEDVQRTLGKIEGHLEAQDQRHKELRTAMFEQGKKLDTVVRYLERQKGARHTLLAIGSALAAACGTVAGFTVTWWTSRHP